MHRFLALLTALLFCGASQTVYASHSLGYDTKYTTTTNGSMTTYRVTISLYIDCEHGDSAAIKQDGPIQLSIFKSTSGQRITVVEATQIGAPVQLNHIPLTGCVQDTQTYCIRKTDFYFEYKSYNADTLTIVNERCCLADISNINNPEEHGFGLIIHLSPPSQPNNSAVFGPTPPVSNCINTPFEIDVSATDADGDSLSYHFAPLYDGGSANDAKPVAQSINLRLLPLTSPATFDRPLGNDGSFLLNASTGKVTGICRTAGEYMASIACDEWRNGQLINTTVRMYTYSFADCIRGATALLETDSIIALAGNRDSLIAVQCNGRTVQFTNKSTKASSYLWDFGDPTSTADVATVSNPQYTYPGNGLYKVRLVAIGEGCNDTLYGNVLIGDDLVDPDFEIQDLRCLDQPIRVADRSVVIQGTIDRYTWIGGNGAVTGSQATMQYNQPGNYTISHYVTTVQGCIFQAKKEINIRPSGIHSNNDTVVVRGTLLQLNASGSVSGYQWRWNGLNVLNAYNIPDPIADLQVPGYNYYIVEGTDQYGCPGKDSTNVIVSDKAYAVVPSAFTPNGDGRNDLLRPRLSGGQLSAFIVYDRYGRQVFNTSSAQDGWDGTYKGNLLDAGTYFWVVKIKNGQGLGDVYKGDTMLLR